MAYFKKYSLLACVMALFAITIKDERAFAGIIRYLKQPLLNHKSEINTPNENFIFHKARINIIKGLEYNPYKINENNYRSEQSNLSRSIQYEENKGKWDINISHQTSSYNQKDPEQQDDDLVGIFLNYKKQF